MSFELIKTIQEVNLNRLKNKQNNFQSSNEEKITLQKELENDLNFLIKSDKRKLKIKKKKKIISQNREKRRKKLITKDKQGHLDFDVLNTKLEREIIENLNNREQNYDFFNEKIFKLGSCPFFDNLNFKQEEKNENFNLYNINSQTQEEIIKEFNSLKLTKYNIFNNSSNQLSFVFNNELIIKFLNKEIENKDFRKKHEINEFFKENELNIFQYFILYDKYSDIPFELFSNDEDSIQIIVKVYLKLLYTEFIKYNDKSKNEIKETNIYLFKIMEYQETFNKYFEKIKFLAFKFIENKSSFILNKNLRNYELSELNDLYYSNLLKLINFFSKSLFKIFFNTSNLVFYNKITQDKKINLKEFLKEKQLEEKIKDKEYKDIINNLNSNTQKFILSMIRK